MHFDRNTENDLALDVRGCSYSFERGKSARSVLKDVDLKVSEGTIYGLLGPSGCGKTTLLSCIIGRLKTKPGDIKVFGEDIGTAKCLVPGPGVGYMPQEMSLYMELTISETLLYFGRLHGVNVKVIQARSDLLIKFLDLPPKCSTIAKLSSGQQRRVSLAVALIHQPPLLVLDEPTVGVDPVLRRSIWDHLVQLTSHEGMTVIITTHYIEEARQANTVGFMRNGYLLKETNPSQELSNFNESTLEESFLRLCRNVDLKSDNLEAPKSVLSENVKLLTPSEKTECNETVVSNTDVKFSKVGIGDFTEKMNEPYVSVRVRKKMRARGPVSNLRSNGFHKVLAILLKNFTRFRRNILLLIFQFILPGLTVLMISACIGHSPYNLSLAIVNKDIMGDLKSNSPCLSSYYLEHLQKRDIIQVQFSDKEEGMSSVQRGDTWGMIYIPENFSASLLERFSEGVDSSQELLNKSTIDVYLDTSNFPVSAMLQQSIYDSFHEMTIEAFDMMGLREELAELPIQIRDPVFGRHKNSFTEFLAPGIILGITYMIAVGLTTMTIVEERINGLMERTWVCGVTSYQILVGHLLTQFLVLIIQVFGTILIVEMVIDIAFRGMVTWIIALTLLQGICGMSFGLLISSISNDGNVAMMLAVGQFFPNIILSGILWPVEGQPPFLRIISSFLPQTLPTSALRSIMSRGWGMEHTSVWSSFLVLIGWTAFFYISTVLIFKFKK